MTTLPKWAVFESSSRTIAGQAEELLVRIWWLLLHYLPLQAESLKGLPNHCCSDQQCYAKTSRTNPASICHFTVGSWRVRSKTQIHMTQVFSLIHLDYLSSPQISSDTGGIPHIFPSPCSTPDLCWQRDPVIWFCLLLSSTILFNSVSKLLHEHGA